MSGNHVSSLTPDLSEMRFVFTTQPSKQVVFGVSAPVTPPRFQNGHTKYSCKFDKPPVQQVAEHIYKN